MGTIGEWIASALAAEPKADAIVLSSIGQIGPPEVLETFAVSKTTKPEAIADRIERIVIDRTAALHRGGTYLVVGTRRGEALRRHSFVMEAPPRAELMDEPAETPNKALMRHNERLQGMLAKMTEGTVGMLAAENHELRARLAELEGRRWKQAELMEELLDRRADRELEQARSARAEERKDRALNLVGAAGRAVLARVTGATPAARLLQSIDPELLAGLIGALKPHQLKLLRSVIASADDGELAQQEIGEITGLATAPTEPPPADEPPDGSPADEDPPKKGSK